MTQRHQQRKNVIVQIKSSLTFQQAKVVSLFLCGLSTAQIASELERSVRTCREHLLIVRKKWGVRSDYALAMEAFRRGYCEIPEVNQNIEGKKSLTPRELHVLRFLVDDKSPKDISIRMGISHRTVEIHIAHIREKWEVINGVELVCEAFRRGYLGLKEENCAMQQINISPYIRVSTERKFAFLE